jgi:hypothetical protein
MTKGKPYFGAVVGLAWLYDPESYVGGSVTTGRAIHARQVKGDDPDKTGFPGPPSWGLGVMLTTPPRKKILL